MAGRNPKRKPLIALVFGFVCLSSNVALAFDGNELLMKCNIVINKMDNPNFKLDPEKLANSMYCMGFLHGVVTTIMHHEVNDPLGIKMVCLPDGITTKQTVRVVVKYLKAHPEELHKEAVILTWGALYGAYSCKKS